MKRFIQRFKESISKDLDNLTQTDSISSQRVLFKWILIGVLAFLSVLFALLQVSFSPKNEEITFTPDEIVSESDPMDDGPMFDFEVSDEEKLPLLEESDEIVLKDRIWEALILEDYTQAAKLASDAIESHELREDSDLVGWYQDIYTAASVYNFDSSEQPRVLTSFATARFQAALPPYASVLTLATIIDDPDSLLPVDVQEVQVMSESMVDPSECQGISNYMDEMLIHFKKVYQATILFNGELVTAYVGIFNNDRLQLLGYYGDTTSFKTDSYWESKRLDYYNNPIFN